MSEECTTIQLYVNWKDAPEEASFSTVTEALDALRALDERSSQAALLMQTDKTFPAPDFAVRAAPERASRGCQYPVLCIRRAGICAGTARQLAV